MTGQFEMITEPQVMEMIGIKSRSAVWRNQKEFGFPLPIRNRPKQYLKAQVEQWILSGGISRSGS